MSLTDATHAAGRTRAQGFSLLEMVVAIAILALALGALYQAASGATRNVRADEKYAYGVELARSLLAANARVPADGVSDSGETEGGFSWRVSTRPVDFQRTSMAAVSLHEIEVGVSWEDGGRLREVVLNSVVEGIFTGMNTATLMPRQSTGFTLVEVVVALSILSLVMLVTVTGLRTLANTQTALERMTDRIDEVRTVSAFVRDTMESAVVGGGPGDLSLGGSGSEKKGYFALFPDALAWRSTILIGESFGGSYLLRVAREDDLLVLRWQQADARGEPGDWAAADARTLVRDLEEFEVSWRDSYNGEWRQDWVPGDEALWVKLQIRASDRYWPELIMQVPQ